MEPPDLNDFSRVLTMMSNYFSDPMTDDRKEVYWNCAERAGITMPEWIHACNCATQEATFHKVPLFGVLMSYITERREAQKRARRELEKVMQVTAHAESLKAHTGLTAEEAKVAIDQIVAMLESKMSMPERVRRLSDYYADTPPTLYTGMSEEEYAQKRATMLRQMQTLPEEASMNEQQYVQFVYNRIRQQQEANRRQEKTVALVDDPLAL